MRPSASLVLALLGLPALAACEGGVDGRSESQIAYDTCADNYNLERASLYGRWAFVSGVSPVLNACFWGWGAASTSDAISETLEDCHKKYASCYVFATSDGLTDWAQGINLNGGLDPAGRGPSLADVVGVGVSSHLCARNQTCP